MIIMRLLQRAVARLAAATAAAQALARHPDGFRNGLSIVFVRKARDTRRGGHGQRFGRLALGFSTRFQGKARLKSRPGAP